MEETFLSPVIAKLIDLLAEEVKLLKGVRKQVKSLQKELEFIQPLLKHAEAKLQSREMRDVMQVWVKHIREEANRIEDIIDENRYFVEAEKHHRQSGCISCFHKACGFSKKLKQRHGIASKIRDVKYSLREIKDRGQGYGLRPLEQGASSTTTTVEAPIDPRLGSLFIEKDEFVELETESKALIRKLVEGSSARSVISLVGQGGIGKTTLAKKVYDDEIVKGRFELHAWVTVSQPYNLKKLLRNLKSQICTSERGMEETDKEAEQQIQDLRESLEAKSYVVVFDDVWQEEFWGVIKSALPDNNMGSRILITTRNVVVANSSPCDLVQLQTWSPAFAWELFCKKAFKSEFQCRCPQDLKNLSHEIVKRCQGLPLVIATTAGLLSTKEKVELEWQRVLDDLNSKSRMNSQFESISQILSLSYYDLPYPLNYCFLYFGLFPEDYSISNERLYRLWIAEGFIQARGEMTLEEVAEAYLNELSQRNLVTLSQSFIVGEGKFYGVHDLMHDVILSRASEVCFSRTFDGNKSRFRGAGRRLRISGSIDNVLKNVGDSPIRSLFFLDIDEQITESFIVTLFKKFNLLEVLDFDRVHLNILPKEVGNLFQLKYLSLRYTKVKILPKSVKNLRKLQSLYIRDNLIQELHVEINELRNLRHLIAYSRNKSSFDYGDGVRMHEGFGNLEELQSLAALEAHPGGIGVVKELKKLRKLRWLGVSKITSETWRGVCDSIRNMNHLQRLGFAANDENEVLDLEYISSPLRFLRELLVIGRLQNLPDTIPKFRNLRVLYLDSSWLIDDPCKCLKVLPNLEKLGLAHNACVGEELHFENGDFEKLKVLWVNEMDGLKHIEIDEGALPALEMLRLFKCPLLKEIPSVKHLTKLKHFEIDGRSVLKSQVKPFYCLVHV
ncbi:hypothetical protein UlMin_003077 [Ulmus minor]